MFDCCFTEHVRECSVVRFLFRAAFEGLSDRFWPQPRLESDSPGAWFCFLRPLIFPSLALGYLGAEWPELPRICSFPHPASRTTVSLWLSVLVVFTCLFPHLCLPTRHFSLRLQWGLSAPTAAAPCSRNSRRTFVWFLGLLSSHTRFVTWHNCVPPALLCI